MKKETIISNNMKKKINKEAQALGRLSHSKRKGTEEYENWKKTLSVKAKKRMKGAARDSGGHFVKAK